MDSSRKGLKRMHNKGLVLDLPVKINYVKAREIRWIGIQVVHMKHVGEERVQMSAGPVTQAFVTRHQRQYYTRLRI